MTNETLAPEAKRSLLSTDYRTLNYVTGPLIFVQDVEGVAYNEMVAILIFVVFLYAVPETPRWLAARGMESQALAVLDRIGGAEYAEQQMKEIRNSLSGATDNDWTRAPEP